jgi:cell division protein DivIC
LEAQQEKREELDNYEEYIQTEEYKESVAKSKLGLVHQNEIIFREND